MNTVDFFNQINMLYGRLACNPSPPPPIHPLLFRSIAEACTAESCPVMCAGCDPGPVCEYQWADGVTFKKALPLPLLVRRPACL